MVLNFEKVLAEAQEEIGFSSEKAEFIVSDINNPSSLETIESKYSKALWTVVELVNERYKDKLSQPFNLYNWIEYNLSDELAYFLNEASNNCLNYSETKSPYKFIVYFGTKGFIVGISQQGKGFDAHNVFEKKIKNNEGAGFSFFKDCSSLIFFDDPFNAREVYFRYLF